VATELERREDREDLMRGTLLVFVVMMVLTYLIGWDDASPIYAGDSSGPTLLPWGGGIALGLVLRTMRRRV